MKIKKNLLDKALHQFPSCELPVMFNNLRKPTMYTEDQLFKAVRYALEAQKKHNYDVARELLLSKGDVITEQEEDLLNLLSATGNTFGAFAMIDRYEVLNHAKS